MLSLPPDFSADASAIHSGAQTLIGYGIDLTPEDGSAQVVLDVEDRHLNRNGTLHGGIVAMLLDAAAGFAASRALSPTEFSPVVTVSLTTNFVAAARVERVICTGRMSGGGRSIVYSGAELRNADGALLASATGVFKRVRKEQ